MSNRLFARALTLALSLTLCAHSALAVPDQSDPRNRNRGPMLIRDAEIEGLLRAYANPIFKAAKIDAKSAQVYVIGDQNINAFVANGQRIFVHAGLITQSKTPNQVIGVMAHEAGHIAGGHLAKINGALAEASTTAIIGSLLGAAAMIGGAITGSKEASQAGGAVIMGSNYAAQRGVLQYQRGMEASADEAALRYLNASGQSGKGMLDLFQKLADDGEARLRGADPYAFSHPMPKDRIIALRAKVAASPNFDAADSQSLTQRHNLAKAKLIGFLQPEQVFKFYPKTDTSQPARYAHAIANFRRGNLKTALPLLESLTQAAPKNPFFWELKAQALLENGKAVQALPAIQRARAILPGNGLLLMLHAQILLASESPANADQAISLLRKAQVTEPGEPNTFKFLSQAYGLKGDIARAVLATAEFAFATGDKKTAKEKAGLAKRYLREGTPDWYRADDIEHFSAKK